MRLNRGEDWFFQWWRVAFQLARSRDGKWAKDDGELIGFFQVGLPHRGETPHDNKKCCWLIVGEYSLFIAWFIRF